ncbi:MAG: PA2778 family cysteine peptidase [Sulfuricaulis sp.]|nr:PA2778 family cysteine peptidase [Sulfuricaulis sp.]
MHSSKARLIAGFLFFSALLSGCSLIAPQTYALKEQRPPDLARRVELTQVPFFPQEDYYCGPAALAMVLNAAGVKVSPEDLVDQVYLPGRKGSLQVEMLAAARRHGLVAYELAPRVTDMLREIAAGTPAIVLENYGPFRWYPLWHYSVVVGYDLDRLEVIRRSGTRPRRPTPLPIFENLWKDEGYWAMVAVPPDRVPATATEQRYASAVIALEKSGQFKHALTAYNALLRRWPASLAGQMGRGNTAYALQDLETAEAAFRQATQKHPDAAAAFNNLAQVLAERGKLNEALATAERAVSLGGPLQSATQVTLEEIRKKAEGQTQ